MKTILCQFLLSFVFGAASLGAAPLDEAHQEEAIRDSFAWAEGIIDGLARLAPPLSARPIVQDKRPQQRVRSTSSSRSVATQASAPAAAAPVISDSTPRSYEYSQKGRYTEVNIKIKDRFENGASKSFRVTVTSTQPLSAWTIRLKGTDTVVAQGGLFGETSFSKTITEPYRPDFVLNLTVKRDGSDWVDYFKLFNEGTVQSR